MPVRPGHGAGAVQAGGLYVPLTGQSGPIGPVSQDGYESAFFDDDQPADQIENSYAQSNAPPPGYYGEDAEYACFFQEDPEDDTNALVMIDGSAPVGGRSMALPQEPIEEMTDGYEDPDIDTFEWSGPIQPNAPPPAQFFGDEAEQFDDDPSDPIPLPSDYQQASYIAPQPIPDWDWPENAD